MRPNACLILTSANNEKSAQQIARQLVEQRLAACVQISAAGTSIYRWQEKIEAAREHFITIKTTDAQASAIIDWLAVNHPYDTPEILRLEAEAADDYLQWMRASTS